MDNDFPAAHSMDTEWFAVDADGHVGFFYSGEAGAVPTKAVRDWPSDLWTRLTEIMPRGEARHDLAGHVKTGPQAEPSRHSCANAGETHGVLMFLRSLDSVSEGISAGNAIVAPAASGVAVIFRPLSNAEAVRMHQEGHCLGCFNYFWPPEWTPPPIRAAELGLFHYGHPLHNWIALPYGRAMVPSLPLHIDQLPPDLRAVMGAMRFDRLRFVETSHIQPCERDEVGCWQSAYLSVDGREIHEIVNNAEAESASGYEVFYQQLITARVDWLQGITIHPPRKR